MGRYRSRSKSYSPRRRSRTPPRRTRYDEPRDRHRHRDRRSPAPSGLLVRNISLDTRPEDLRISFEKFGPVKDIYLPRNYYTGEPRGFGFVKFRYPEDAAEAKDRLNHTIIGGREIRIVYAEENRKTPQEMRKISRVSGRYGGRRTPLRSPSVLEVTIFRKALFKLRKNIKLIVDSKKVLVFRERKQFKRFYQSHSPCSERDYRSSKRSLTPRESSPHDGRGYRARERSQSPRSISPHDEKYKSRKSYSPRDIPSHDDDYRSPTSREISPQDRKDLRSSQRSVSPRSESPCFVKCNPKQMTPMSRDVFPCNENDNRSNRRSPSTRELSRNGVKGGTSPVDSRDYRLNHGPLSHEETGGSISHSRSWSYSPR